MYQVRRSSGNVIVSRNDSPVFSAPDESFLVYKVGEELKVSKAKDLTDEALLLALANAVEIRKLTT